MWSPVAVLRSGGGARRLFSDRSGRPVVDPSPDCELPVWLDDLLDECAAPAGWIHFRGGGAAAELLGTGRVVELSLDDELGDDESQGWGSTSSTIAQQVVEARPVAARRDPDSQRRCGRERLDGESDRPLRRRTRPR